MPLVTVALAVYNNAANLEECLQCYEKQTYPHMEILCIDDCSNDNSVEILRRHAESDPRYRIIEKEHNAGLSDTRNISIDEAKGEYLYLCDADDICDPDMIEKAVTKAEEDKADMVIWDFYEFGKQIYRLMKKNDPSRLREDMSRKELCHIGSFMWTHLFRTSSLRELNLPFPLGRTKQDLPVHWAACIMMDKISIIPERLYGYRISAGQTSRKKGKVLLDFIYVHDYLRDYLEKNGKFDEYRKDFFRSMIIAMYSVYITIDKAYLPEAISLFKKRICPEMAEIAKDISLSVKLFISYMSGNAIAGALLKVSKYVRKMI
ncbi:MAG: glycosyltransferase family 2 protein [Muribaculaceae bacterium]